MREIKLKNPLLLNAITFFKNKDFNEELIISYLKNILNLEKIENRELSISNEYILRYNIINEIDYTTCEVYFTLKDDNKEISNIEMLNKFSSF
jgi:hypothetical protein